MIQTISPAVISGYDDTTPDLLNNQAGNDQYLRDSTGLIENVTYGATTTASNFAPGDVAGYESQRSVQQGELGTPIVQSSQQYTVQTTTSGVTIYPTATQTNYRNTDGTRAQTTSPS